MSNISLILPFFSQYMVLNGLGYVFIPSTIVNKTDKVRKTLMIYQQDSLDTRVVKAFVNFVKDINFQSTV